MAEITASIGVSIDPSAAISGARRAVEAAERMRTGMNGAASGIDRAMASMRRSTQQTAVRFADLSGEAKRAADALANTLRRTEGTGGFFKRLAASLKEASTAFGNAGSAVGIFAPRLGNVVNVAQQVGGALSKAKASFAAVGSSAGGAAGGIGLLSAGMGSIALVATGVGAVLAGIVAGLVAFKVATAAAAWSWNFLKEAISAGSAGADAQLTLEVLTGSVEKATKAVKDLKELASKSPLETGEIVAAGTQLIAFGVKAEDVTERLRQLGDISSAISSLSLKELADIIGKINTQGFFDGVDFKQLQSRGVNIGDALATTMGVARSSIKELIEAGKVGVPQVTAALENMTSAGGQFFGLMEKKSGTFSGMIDNLKDKWGLLQGDLGGPIQDELRPLLRDADDLMTKLRAGATSILPAIREFTANLVAGLETAFGSMDGFKAAIAASADFLKLAFQEAFRLAGDVLGVVFGQATYDLGQALRKILSDPLIYDNVGIGLQRAAADFGNAMMEKLATAARVAQAIQTMGGSELTRLALPGMADGFGNIFAKPAFKEGAAGGQRPTFDGVLDASMERLRLALGESTEATKFGAMVTEKRNANAVEFANKQIPESVARPAEGVGPLYDQQAAGNFFAKQLEEAGRTAAQIRMVAPLGGAIETEADKELAKLNKTAESFLRRDPVERRKLDDMAAQQLFDQGAISQQQLATGLARNEDTLVKALQAAAGPAGKTEVRKALAVDGEGTAADWQKGLKSDADRVRSDIATPSEDLAKSLERLNQLKEAGAITSEEFSRATAKAKGEYADAIDSMAEKQRQLAEEGKSELQKLAEAWGNLGKQADAASVAAANSVSDNLSGALGDLAMGTKSAGEAFEAMAAGIINDITRIVIKLLVQYAISNALGFNLPGIGSLTGVTVRHDGSSEGTARRRNVDPAIFAGARKYHDGGTVPGLKNNEVPAVLERGETVLTQRESVAYRTSLTGSSNESRAQSQFTILNVDDANRVKEIIAGDPDVILNVISRNVPKIKKMIG